MRRREMRREMLIKPVSKTVEANENTSLKIALQSVQEGDWWEGCPNFASKKASLQSKTKRNANGFAWFCFLFAKLWKNFFASFRFVSLQKFRFVSLKNMFRFKVSLREQFCFKSFASFH